ncbi:hypothetical protein [Mycobacterium sp. 141]|uniref:hypothetical protein n=1 Tax=Mycobacterium sp. 141 TaxID=1120797 RepID=UPI0012DF6D7F|nr:hypothetical protein [Mycobacterium sp. 141]
MIPTLRLDTGATVTLGKVIARAGEGTIYEVADRNDLVVKAFHSDLKDLDAKRAKVAAMTASPPAGVVQADGFVVLTWPLHSVEGLDGTAGYVMARIDTTNAVEIHSVSNPSNRTSPLPSAPQWTRHVTWEHLVTVAANLCLAVDTVHGVDAVIGDFQERNVLVSDTARVTLVDCDSMQFTAADGQQFLCGVGRPEFTAPELAGVNLSTTARDRPSDLFALAVHIHLLLMAGNHPFLRGEWTGAGEQPSAIMLAKSAQWAGGPGSALRTHPLAPPVSFLPNEIQRLFSRAFTDGAHNPGARPSAAEWLHALTALRVRTCSRAHQIPVGTRRCPWCAIDGERAKRRSQARELAPSSRTIHYTAAPSAASAPLPANASSHRGRFLALAGLATLALLALIGLAVHQTTTPVRVDTTPRTSSLSSTTSSTPWIVSSVYPTTYISTQTTTVRSTYPPPDAQSYESVYRNAKIGECVNRQLGPARSDGSFEVTSLYLTDCGDPDATNKVTNKTNNVKDCPYIWVHSDKSGLVLCLTKN